AFGFSSIVTAAPIPSTPITSTECAVLGESVRLSLSNGVSGAYACSEVNNSINIGTCHTAGSRSTTLKCAQTGEDEDGEVTWNHADCAADPTPDTVELETPSYRGFRASTTGGSVGAQSLSGNCTATTVEELVGVQ